MSQAETMAVTMRDISDVGDRYINQPEKGPSFHTNEFMNGYNDGCGGCYMEEIIEIAVMMTAAYRGIVK